MQSTHSDHKDPAMTTLRRLLVLGLFLASAHTAYSQQVIRSAGSGPWSAATTWEGGKVPGDGARVLILSGHKVVYDVKSEAVIRGINVAGTLSFAPDKDTRLDTGL